jgi:hypothetical protein
MTQYNFCSLAYECWAGAWVELCGSMKFLDNLAGTMPQTLRDGGLHVIRCERTQGMAAAVIEALLAYTQWSARAMLGPAQHELGYVTREPLARASRLLSRPNREIAP